MAKRESNFVNMVLTLFLVTFIAAGALGFVYDFTKDAIEMAQLKAQNEAIEQVLPNYEELGESYKVPAENAEDSLVFFPAYRDGEQVGVAVKTFTNKGFSGYISIMVGIGNDGNITGYQVLEHAETPGLGSKMDVWFSNPEKPGQYIIGKNPGTTDFAVRNDGGDIDGITASTITSRAFLEAVKRAWNAFDEKKPEATSALNQN